MWVGPRVNGAGALVCHVVYRRGLPCLWSCAACPAVMCLPQCTCRNGACPWHPPWCSQGGSREDMCGGAGSADGKGRERRGERRGAGNQWLPIAWAALCSHQAHTWAGCGRWLHGESPGQGGCGTCCEWVVAGMLCWLWVGVRQQGDPRSTLLSRPLLVTAAGCWWCWAGCVPSGMPQSMLAYVVRHGIKVARGLSAITHAIWQVPTKAGTPRGCMCARWLMVYVAGTAGGCDGHVRPAVHGPPGVVGHQVKRVLGC